MSEVKIDGYTQIPYEQARAMFAVGHTVFYTTSAMSTKPMRVFSLLNNAKYCTDNANNLMYYVKGEQV